MKINVFAGVSVAGGTNRSRIRVGFSRSPKFLRHLRLNRQAVAVPAWNVGRAFAPERLVFDDDVLENLVQRGADVDVAVGEGRAVMEDEFFRGLTGGLNPFIETAGLPFFEALRFARDEVGLHGKAGLRKVQRVFLVHLLRLKRARKLTGAFRVIKRANSHVLIGRWLGAAGSAMWRSPKVVAKPGRWPVTTSSGALSTHVV